PLGAGRIILVARHRGLDAQSAAHWRTSSSFSISLLRDGVMRWGGEVLLLILRRAALIVSELVGSDLPDLIIVEDPAAPLVLSAGRCVPWRPWWGYAVSGSLFRES